MYHKITIAIIALISFNCFSQSAIKHQKQQTTFFYTQLNLHGGYVNDYGKGRLDFTNHSPDNQVVFRVFSKNQNILQKGYVKTFGLDSYNIRMSIPFNKSVNILGHDQEKVSLKLLDTWLKFNTKWDRTSFWIGQRSIPYGHNPKMDPVSNFMTNITKMDIGFVQDLGLFIKTPVSSNLDLELSLTSGGFLNKPIAVYQIQGDSSPNFSFTDYKYENTWLLTSRIGSPTFKKNEFGIILTSGKVKNPENINELSRINRIGGDWVYKYYEKFKWSNQFVVGDNYIENKKYTTSIHLQSAMDYYLLNNFFISTSFAYTGFANKGMNYKNYLSTTSFTYTFSPHTRFRLNHFYASRSTADKGKWGLLLQFVTGFGKRP